MKPSEALQKHRTEILAIIAAHSVTNPRVFGSAARGDDSDSSDLDILVDPGAGTDYFEIFAIEREIADVTGVDVELLLVDELRPHVRLRALRDAVAL